MNSIQSYFEQVEAYIKEHRSLYIKMSHEIHDNPEIGNEEHFACKLLTDLLIQEGFSVEIDMPLILLDLLLEKQVKRKAQQLEY